MKKTKQILLSAFAVVLMTSPLSCEEFVAEYNQTLSETIGECTANYNTRALRAAGYTVWTATSEDKPESWHLVRNIVDRLLDTSLRGQFRYYAFPFNPIKVRVVNDSVADASTPGGGYLFITEGLLRIVENENALAGIIAHELAHVTEHHYTTIIEKNSPFNLGPLFLANADLYCTVLDLTTIPADVDHDTVKPQKSDAEYETLAEHTVVRRRVEIEADERSIAMLMEAGYNPAGLYHWLLSIDENRQNNVALLEELCPNRPEIWDATYIAHPRPAERAFNLEVHTAGDYGLLLSETAPDIEDTFLTTSEWNALQDELATPGRLFQLPARVHTNICGDPLPEDTAPSPNIESQEPDHHLGHTWEEIVETIAEEFTNRL